MKPALRLRGRGARVIALCAVVILSIAASLGGYLASREYTEQPSSIFGAADDVENRVDVTAWISRVDVAAQTVTVTITDAQPLGSLAAPDGTFAQNAVLVSNSVQTVPVKVAAGEHLSSTEQHFSLSGVVTDFPFDRYTAYLSLRMTGADGEELPLAVTVLSTDASFVVDPYYDQEQDDYLNVDLGISRSAPTMVFGVFIMILMLGLAFASAVVAYYVIRRRQGVVFEAYAVMAALLFAMVPLRNAVPGDPPIGSVIDFMAFFVAEAVISVALIASVVIGYRHQREIDTATRT